MSWCGFRAESVGRVCLRCDPRRVKPNRMPVRTETPKAKASTTPDGLASMGTSSAPGNAMARSMRVPA